MNNRERLALIGASIPLMVTLAAGLLGYELGRLDFVRVFRHEPQFGISYKDGQLDIGFMTDINMLRVVSPVYGCGKSEMVAQTIGPDQHVTDHLDWGAHIYAFGDCHGGGDNGFHSRSKPFNLTPPPPFKY